MNDYLKIMLSHYNDGIYLKTNLELMAQQAETGVGQLLEILWKEGVNFSVECHWFRPKKGNPVHDKGGAMILLYKDMKSIIDKSKI